MLALIVALPVSCVRSDSRGAPGPRKSAVPGSECPNEAAVAADSSKRSAGLEGDVDGDDAEDRVFVATDDSGPPECRSFVVVVTRSARLSARVFQPGFEASLNLPALNSLVALDTAPGAEVVVDVAAGASTVFAAVFSVHDGRLVRLKMKGDDPATDDLFAHGSSAGHASGAECVSGSVVVSTAVFTGEKWRVERRFFRASEASLRVQRDRTERRLVRPQQLVRLPEFSGPLFSRCG